MSVVACTTSGAVRWVLSEVVRLRDLGEPIALGEAARILHCTIAEVRDLIAAGQLTSQPAALRPVYRAQVEELARAHGLPPPRSRSGEEPTGYVGTPVAARILGRSVSRIRQLAADEQLPAVKDRAGRYWFREDQLVMIRQAWDVAAEYRTRW